MERTLPSAHAGLANFRAITTSATLLPTRSRGGDHPHVTVVVDEAAAAHLKNADFYRYALKYKLAQQKY
jgi:hypothetical protein